MLRLTRKQIVHGDSPRKCFVDWRSPCCSEVLTFSDFLALPAVSYSATSLSGFLGLANIDCSVALQPLEGGRSPRIRQESPDGPATWHLWLLLGY